MLHWDRNVGAVKESLSTCSCCYLGGCQCSATTVVESQYSMYTPEQQVLKLPQAGIGDKPTTSMVSRSHGAGLPDSTPITSLVQGETSSTTMQAMEDTAKAPPNRCA